MFHYRYLMMNSGSPRLLVIPKADIQMENQEPGSFLEQLLTFKKKKSLLEKVKDVSLAAGRYLKKVRIHTIIIITYLLTNTSAYQHFCLPTLPISPGLSCEF